MNIEGLVLESKYPQYRLFVKGPLEKKWRDGFPVDEQKLLIIEFDRFLCEMDEMISNQEWTEEDKEFCARGLEIHLKNPLFRDVWVHEISRPGKPWPTYNETHHNQIAAIAAATGQIEAALSYETRGREGGPRPSVEAKLRELLEGQSDPVEVEAEREELFAV